MNCKYCNLSMGRNPYSPANSISDFYFCSNCDVFIGTKHYRNTIYINYKTAYDEDSSKLKYYAYINENDNYCIIYQTYGILELQEVFLNIDLPTDITPSNFEAKINLLKTFK